MGSLVLTLGWTHHPNPLRVVACSLPELPPPKSPLCLAIPAGELSWQSGGAVLPPLLHLIITSYSHPFALFWILYILFLKSLVESQPLYI